MITILDQYELYENEISEKEALLLVEKLEKKLKEFNKINDFYRRKK